MLNDMVQRSVGRAGCYKSGMANANLVLPDGTTVAIEGTAEEVALLLDRFSGSGTPPSDQKPVRQRTKKRRAAKRSGESTSRAPSGTTDYIRELIEEDFFKAPRGLSDVKNKLAEGGHIYPLTNLSPVMLGLTKKRELRRIKEGAKKGKGGTWKYVNR
jgi:hypothetical protein